MANHRSYGTNSCSVNGSPPPYYTNGTNTRPPSYRASVDWLRSASRYSVPGATPSNDPEASPSAGATDFTPLLYPKRHWCSLTRSVVGAFCVLPICALLCYSFYTKNTKEHAYWEDIKPSLNCSSVGTREYTGILSYMPEGFHPYTSCSSVPVTIHGHRIKSPSSCWSEAFQREEQTVDDEGNQATRHVTRTITKARWLVDFNELDCVPAWDSDQPAVPDQYCHEYGIRMYSAFMRVSFIPPGLNVLEACRNTSSVFHGQSVYPNQCLEEVNKHGEPVLRAQFLVDEASCRAVWSNVTADDQCWGSGVKRYSAFLEEVPSEFDGWQICQEEPQMIMGQRKKPDSCEKVILSGGLEKIVGRWMIDYNVPECQTRLQDVKRMDCIKNAIRRVEAHVTDIREEDDWYRMCTTTPLDWRGARYLPTQCVIRRPTWFGDEYKVALFAVLDPSCAR